MMNGVELNLSILTVFLLFHFLSLECKPMIVYVTTFRSIDIFQAAKNSFIRHSDVGIGKSFFVQFGQNVFFTDRCSILFLDF